MRISGNYLERFLFTGFPFIVFGGLIFLILKKVDIVILLATMFIFSAILFIIDKLPLWRTPLLNFTVSDNKLFADKLKIEETHIVSIRLFKTSPPHSLIIFEVEFEDNSVLKFMDRPKTIFYKSKNKLRSKSLDILFNEFPILKSKLKELH